MADIVNAKITSTTFGYEGHGILTAMVTFMWGGKAGDDRVQSFPAYNLNGPLCAPFVKGLLDALGVDRWEGVKGQVVRLELEEGWRPIAVGHIIHDRWFNPRECAARVEEEASG